MWKPRTLFPDEESCIWDQDDTELKILCKTKVIGNEGENALNTRVLKTIYYQICVLLKVTGEKQMKDNGLYPAQPMKH